jgi:NADH dehydrogenase
MVKTKRIVILGAGFGGLKTALELEKQCGQLSAHEIVLIDRRAEHLYTPLLYEVATGFLSKPSRISRGELRQGVSISYDAYMSILCSKMITYKRGEVIGLDTKSQIVHLGGGETMPYDVLLVALGSEVAYYGIPGLKEFSYPLKNLRDAFNLRERIFQFLERYKAGAEPFLSIVVGGGGATGVEFAAEIAHHFRNLERKKFLKKGSWSMTLVDLAPDVLTAFPKDLRRCAQARLESLGIRVLLNTAVKEVTAGAVVVETDGKKTRLEADVFAWCGGIKPSSTLEHLGLPVGPKGHLIVDENFLVMGSKNIFAIGDNAQIKAGDGFVPALAQAAYKEAEHVVKNIRRCIEGKALSPWNPPKSWWSIVPLGGKYAAAKIGPFKMMGVLAYLLRKLADLRYWLLILPPLPAFRVWFSGANTYIKND